MSVAVGVLIVLAAVAVVAMTVLVLVAQWREYRAILRRAPPERRRRALLAGGGAMLYMVAARAVLIASPWGQATWLILFGGVAVVLLALTVVLAVTGARRKP